MALINAKDKERIDFYIECNREEFIDIFDENYYIGTVYEVIEQINDFDEPAAQEMLREARERRSIVYNPTSYNNVINIHLCKIRDHAFDFGIYQKVINEDNEGLVNGIYTSVRFKYLSEIAVNQVEYSGQDCLYVWSLMRAIMINDEQTINAYLQHFPFPVKLGHPFTIGYANAVVALLRNDKGAIEEQAKKISRLAARKSFTKMQSAILQCLDGIYKLDLPQVLTQLEEVITLNKRQKEIVSLEKYYPVAAYALYHLANRFFKSNDRESPIDVSGIKTFDPDLMALLDDTTKRSFIFNVKEASPIIDEWARNTPGEIDARDLLKGKVEEKTVTKGSLWTRLFRNKE